MKGLTAREFAGEAFLRVRGWLRRNISAAFDDPRFTYISDEELRLSLKGSSLAGVAARIRERQGLHITPGLSDLARTSSIVREMFPDSVEESRREAEAILKHRLALFGRELDLGKQIDWHRDPFSSVSWP